jgi:Tfp pilus assembly protein PilO
MYRLLTPILALIVALTLFFTFIQPTFEEYKSIDTEIGDYDQALDSAERLQQRVNELIAQKNEVAQSDLERLMVFLPNAVEEVDVVLILDDLASRHDLVLENISVKSTRAGAGNSGGGSKEVAGKFAFEDDPKELKKEQVREDGTVVRTPTDSIEATLLSFGVTGEYKNFREFVSNLEKSLTLMDITSFSVSEPAEGDFTTYTLGVALYQFAQNDQ